MHYKRKTSLTPCKCPACERMHRVRVIPDRPGFIPRIYCGQCVRRRNEDTAHDPILGAYSFGWR